VLVTFDGARIEEVFDGLDAAIVASPMKDGQRLEDQPIYKRFWAPTAEERRMKLMPFFWGTLMLEPSRTDRHRAGRGDVDSVDGRRLEAIRSRRRSTGAKPLNLEP
jgi:hypothetical protein